MTKYECRIPTIEEYERKWNYEISIHEDERYNWFIWKKDGILRYERKQIIPYFGFLDGETICEATAAIDPIIVQNPENLVDNETAYLFAFRTNKEHRGKGYFSKLFKYMINDLKEKGYKKVTLGVEPAETTNKLIYQKYGFTNHIKTCIESYPNGEKIEVEYYSKNLGD